MLILLAGSRDFPAPPKSHEYTSNLKHGLLLLQIKTTTSDSTTAQCEAPSNNRTVTDGPKQEMICCAICGCLCTSAVEQCVYGVVG